MTTSTSSAGLLRVPALKASMGDWIYYAAFLKLRDIADRVSLADEIHKHAGLRDMIQRQVEESKHVESIRQYLVSRPQRFFNALVIGVYGGAPNFLELDLQPGPRMDPAELPTYFDGALGILEFNGQEKLFAIDGQHRVVGIKKAVVDKHELGNEEVIALFVPHARDSAGMERSRRLFTTLNRYAKPVSKRDIIALDEDDVVAIVTRMLVEDYPLFKNFLRIKKGKALQQSDTQAFTTIETLYEALDTFLDHGEGWSEYKRARPSDSQIAQHYKRAVELWDALSARLPEVADLAGSGKDDQVAGQYRGPHGGHLLFRPVGLLLVIDVIRARLDRGAKLPATVEKLAKAPLELAAKPWAELLWNPVSKRMVTAPENRDIAKLILYHGIGGNLSDFKTTAAQLRADWAAILNRKPGGMTLRRWA